MINSNLGPISHRLATIHLWRTDGRTDGQTTTTMTEARPLLKYGRQKSDRHRVSHIVLFSTNPNFHWSTNGLGLSSENFFSYCTHGRLQKFAKGGRSLPSSFPFLFLSLFPLPFLFPSYFPFSSPFSSSFPPSLLFSSFSPFLPLKSRFPLNQLEGLGKNCKLPQMVRAKLRPKTNLVHSKDVRKPLVAIIFNNFR